MFKNFVNEATLTFNLCTETPLLINSGSGGKIRPGYDMSPVVTRRGDKDTVYIPGSSIKGVFRTRYEQLLTALKTTKPCCNVVDQVSRCKSDAKTGSKKYQAVCPACRLFGNLSIGSRIQFADAYPVGEPVLGYRHGVGISRITGASHPGAKFDYQMVESGVFQFTITLQNFALYQLRLILAIIEDINAGLVTFGMGGTRGNGRLKLNGDVLMKYKRMGDKCDLLTGYFDIDKGGAITSKHALFGSQCEITGLDAILTTINITDKAALEAAMRAENARLEEENSVKSANAV